MDDIDYGNSAQPSSVTGVGVFLVSDAGENLNTTLTGVNASGYAREQAKDVQASSPAPAEDLHLPSYAEQARDAHHSEMVREAGGEGGAESGASSSPKQDLFSSQAGDDLGSSSDSSGAIQGLNKEDSSRLDSGLASLRTSKGQKSSSTLFRGNDAIISEFYRELERRGFRYQTGSGPVITIGERRQLKILRQVAQGHGVDVSAEKVMNVDLKDGIGSSIPVARRVLGGSRAQMSIIAVGNSNEIAAVREDAKELAKNIASAKLVNELPDGSKAPSSVNRSASAGIEEGIINVKVTNASSRILEEAARRSVEAYRSANEDNLTKAEQSQINSEKRKEAATFVQGAVLPSLSTDPEKRGTLTPEGIAHQTRTLESAHSYRIGDKQGQLDELPKEQQGLLNARVVGAAMTLLGSDKQLSDKALDVVASIHLEAVSLKDAGENAADAKDTSVTGAEGSTGEDTAPKGGSAEKPKTPETVTAAHAEIDAALSSKALTPLQAGNAKKILEGTSSGNLGALSPAALARQLDPSKESHLKAFLTAFNDSGADLDKLQITDTPSISPEQLKQNQEAVVKAYNAIVEKNMLEPGEGPQKNQMATAAEKLKEVLITQQLLDKEGKVKKSTATAAQNQTQNNRAQSAERAQDANEHGRSADQEGAGRAEASRIRQEVQTSNLADLDHRPVSSVLATVIGQTGNPPGTFITSNKTWNTGGVQRFASRVRAIASHPNRGSTSAAGRMQAATAAAWLVRNAERGTVKGLGPKEVASLKDAAQSLYKEARADGADSKKIPEISAALNKMEKMAGAMEAREAIRAVQNDATSTKAAVTSISQSLTNKSSATENFAKDLVSEATSESGLSATRAKGYLKEANNRLSLELTQNLSVGARANLAVGLRDIANRAQAGELGTVDASMQKQLEEVNTKIQGLENSVIAQGGRPVLEEAQSKLDAAKLMRQESSSEQNKSATQDRAKDGANDSAKKDSSQSDQSTQQANQESTAAPKRDTGRMPER